MMYSRTTASRVGRGGDCGHVWTPRTVSGYQGVETVDVEKAAGVSKKINTVSSDSCLEAQGFEAEFRCSVPRQTEETLVL